MTSYVVQVLKRYFLKLTETFLLKDVQLYHLMEFVERYARYFIMKTRVLFFSAAFRLNSK